MREPRNALIVRARLAVREYLRTTASGAKRPSPSREGRSAKGRFGPFATAQRNDRSLRIADVHCVGLARLKSPPLAEIRTETLRARRGDCAAPGNIAEPRHSDEMEPRPSRRLRERVARERTGRPAPTRSSSGSRCRPRRRCWSRSSIPRRGRRDCSHRRRRGARGRAPGDARSARGGWRACARH